MKDNSKAFQLDAIDKKLLQELQRNGRISNVELSKKVNLSPTPCLERVKRLEQARIIKGYHATVCPIITQTALLVFVEITLKRTSNRIFQQFAEDVKQHHEVMECHMVAGGFDYLLKLRFKDMHQYREFLGNELANLPSIAHTHTYMVMEEVKNTTFIDLRNI